MSRPNIIFILCDQMRFDALGAAGNPTIQTPNLDFLASSGTRFSHAYSAVPSCLPARATLWSGQSQWHTGVLGMGEGQGPIPHDFPTTLPGELSRAGYRTHLVGKGHFHPHRASMGFQTMELDESGRMEESEHRRFFRMQAPAGVTPDDHGVGFNSWHSRPWHTEERLHPTAWTMTRAIEFLSTRPVDLPFFLNISFARPHSPYVPPPYYFDFYDRRSTPEPFRGEWAAVHDRPADAALPDAWRGRMSDEQIHRARAGYYGEISFIDTQVGRLLNWMQRRAPEVLANTWFLFASDHGDMLGDHNLWRKTYAYEGSAHVPLLLVPPLRGAGRVAREVADEAVELRDIMPTLLQVAGATIPQGVDGESLVPLLDGPAAGWRRYIHGEHCTCYAPEQEMQYVTDGRRKFIWLPRVATEQFFDLEKDPGECDNLIGAPEYAPSVDAWRARLISELRARDCGWVRDGKLFCPPGPLVSPYKEVRRQATEPPPRA